MHQYSVIDQVLEQALKAAIGTNPIRASFRSSQHEEQTINFLAYGGGVMAWRF